VEFGVLADVAVPSPGTGAVVALSFSDHVASILGTGFAGDVALVADSPRLARLHSRIQARRQN
jgi:hypothetical protein